MKIGNRTFTLKCRQSWNLGEMWFRYLPLKLLFKFFLQNNFISDIQYGCQMEAILKKRFLLNNKEDLHETCYSDKIMTTNPFDQKSNLATKYRPQF